MRAASPLLKWLTSSGVDAVGRVLLQVGATALFARLLGPETFGLVALTAVYVGVLSMALAALFEEALTQRLRVRKAHFASAMGLVLLLAAALYGVVALLAAWAPLAPGTPAAAALSLVPVFALILFADGPLSIHTAAARRQRRFRDIALGNLLGLACGTGCGLLLAWKGAGVWSLLAVQPVARFTNLATLAARSPVRLRPSFDPRPARALFAFGGWHLAGRCVDGLSEVTLQTLVTRYFGLEGNGFLNMAMRIVEPVRGITGSIGHNLATAYYARLQATPRKLAGAVEQTIADTALVLQPVFIGLAVTAPLILLVIAGPEWAPSAGVAILLALAAAVASASNFLHSGLSASGRADLGFAFGLGEWITTAGLLVLLSPLGLVAVGATRLLAWTLDAVAVLWVARRIYGVSAATILRSVAIAALLVAAMAAVVIGVNRCSASLPAIVQLGLAVLAGAASYAALALAFRREQVRSILGRLWRSPAGGGVIA